MKFFPKSVLSTLWCCVTGGLHPAPRAVRAKSQVRAADGVAARGSLAAQTGGAEGAHPPRDPQRAEDQRRCGKVARSGHRSKVSVGRRAHSQKVEFETR